MGMSPSLDIAVRALLAQQMGVDVTSHNISNLATPGYSRQRVRLEAIPGTYFPDAIPRPGMGVAVVSRSHLDPNTEKFLAGLGQVERLPSGSAIKFCQVADGSADVYPRLATTCEWDVAAGHALVVAAGGIVTTPDGGSLTFGHAGKNFRVPAFIAWGDPAKAAALEN